MLENRHKMSNAVSEFIKNRKYSEMSIVEYLEKDFGNESWYSNARLIASKFAFNRQLLVDTYYKGEGSRSIDLVIDNDIKVLFGDFTDNQIYKRLFKTEKGLDKIKASYVVKNNLNFAKLIKGESKLGIIAISKCEFVNKALFFIEVFNLTRISNLLYAMLNSNEKRNKHNLNFEDLKELITALNTIRDCIIQQYGSIRNQMSTILNSTCRERNGAKFIESNEYSNELMPIIVKKMAHLLISEKAKQDESMISLSSLVSNTLNYQEKIAIELNKNSIPIKYEYTNPVSGFVSIKTRRELESGSSLSQHELDTLVKTHQQINKIFENSASKIREYALKRKQDRKNLLRLVSGPEIISLYDVTSYYGYSDQRLMSGPLYSSCMRHQGYKRRIALYANNPHMIKMLALVSKGSNKLKARAIVWYDEDKDIYYVDRIFYSKEEYKTEIVSFINSNEKFFSVYSGNGASSEKTLSSFAIKFKYAVPSIHAPYFDTMYHNIYVDKDKNEYIGKIQKVQDGKTLESTDRIWYRLKNIGSSHVEKCRCELCARANSILDINGVKTCKSHVKVDGDKNVYADLGRSMIYPFGFKGVSNDDNEYTSSFVTTKENAGMMPLSKLSTISLSDKAVISCIPRWINNNMSHSIYRLSSISDNGVVRLRESLEFNGNYAYYDDTVRPYEFNKDIVLLLPSDKNYDQYENSLKIMSLVIDSFNSKHADYQIGNNTMMMDYVTKKMNNSEFARYVLKKLQSLSEKNSTVDLGLKLSNPFRNIDIRPGKIHVISVFDEIITVDDNLKEINDVSFNSIIANDKVGGIISINMPLSLMNIDISKSIKLLEE